MMGDYSRFRTRNGPIDLTRLKYLKHIIKYKVIVAAAVYLFLCCIFFPSLRYMMGPDGLNYIAIAELYAAGQWAAAINAYWSPGFSILLAPFVAIGFDGIMAIKLLNILIGFAVLFALAWLCNALHLKSSVLAILLISAVPFIASSAFLNATPDLLVVLVLTTYLTCLLRVQKFNQIKMGLLVGIIGFVGYLSKYYLFPFFLLHFTGTLVLRFITNSNNGLRFSGYLSGILVFIFMSSFWIGAIGSKYGVYNYSLTGPTVRAMFAPSRGTANVNIPVDLPLDRLVEPGVKSLEIPDPSLLALPGGVLYETSTWSPMDGETEFNHQIALINNAFQYTSYWLVRFSPLLIPTLIVLLILPAFRLTNEVRFIAGLMAWTSLALLSGYMTLSVEGRFILFLWVVGATGGVWLFRIVPNIPYKRIVIFIFLSSFTVMPSRWLIVNMGTDSASGKLATTLKAQIDKGQRIASNGNFFKTAYIGQILKAKYLGQLKNISPDTTLSKLRASGVHYFFVWHETGSDLDWSDLGEIITQSKGLGLKIYRVKS